MSDLEVSDASVSGIDISDLEVEQAASADDFQDAGLVTLPDSVDYLEFDAALLLSFLSPFIHKKSATKMVISRSIRLSLIENDRVQFDMCEGVSLMSCIVPCHNNHFPNHKIIDAETFYRIARTHKGKVYLIHRASDVFVDFYGGEVYVPTFRIDAVVYASKETEGEPTAKGMIKTPELLSAIQNLSPALSFGDISDFDFVFVEPDGVYATNGSIVARIKREGFPVVFRRSDLSLIQSILSVIGNSDLSISCYGDGTGGKYFLSSDKFNYIFPKSTSVFPIQYKSAFQKGTGSYYVSMPRFASQVTTLTGLPESSGVVDLIFKKDCLSSVFKNRRGDVSAFKISEQVDGITSEAVFGISLKVLSIVIRIFKSDPFVNITFINDKVLFTAGDKECVVIVKKG